MALNIATKGTFPELRCKWNSYFFAEKKCQLLIVNVVHESIRENRNFAQSKLFTEISDRSQLFLKHVVCKVCWRCEIRVNRFNRTFRMFTLKLIWLFYLGNFLVFLLVHILNGVIIDECSPRQCFHDSRVNFQLLTQNRNRRDKDVVRFRAKCRVTQINNSRSKMNNNLKTKNLEKRFFTS